ncbi:transposase [Turicibacter bilis]|uniref:transposase n=1 Tax=Turicibacter bilis TaxID=2735723 RepID=UPI003F8AF832
MIKDFEQLPLNLSQRHPLYDKIIPKNHPLRLINKHIDFSFVTPLLGANYSINYGRSAYSPEVMFKLLFLKILYNLSDERVIQEAQVNMAYKYFLNLEPNYPLMHPSSLTKFRKLRLNNEEILEKLLSEVVKQAIEVTTGEVSDVKYLETLVEKSKKKSIEVEEVLTDAAY